MKQLQHISLSILLFFLLRDCKFVEGATFNFVNNCGGPVWPGILSNAGSAKLETTGFQLPPGGSRTIVAPTGWSGRFWGRTGCSFDSSGRGSCSTGDCGSNQVECNGAGANPPATLAEFTLASGPSTQDFYDVSLVDGYNLPIMVQPSGSCMATGCTVDLNQKCPAELRVANGDACKSACEAFNKPEYCCSGAYGNPNTCKPTMYSQLFKSACPRSYSYAYDDPTSTFTCTGGADYIVTFCPGSTSPSSSQKSSRDSSTSSTSTPQFSGGITSSGPGNNNDDSNTSNNNNGVMLQDNSWLASLATGDSASAPTKRPKYPLLLAFSLSLVLLL
ncbi:hypothetical protein LUZ62_038482 [Rhynchospora pubera]|uniref:Thaumatin-like protein 1 n=1 Tax=Rhynchospora pubera TaxID=906938 RepID=A0AAV8F695_9POAL|nr:hypothetical protein LUZ62_038482 [Rhynchospora pubera]